jgi:hypothetical protein
MCPTTPTENARVHDLFNYPFYLTASPHAEILSSLSSVRSKQVTKSNQKEGKIPRYHLRLIRVL